MRRGEGAGHVPTGVQAGSGEEKSPRKLPPTCKPDTARRRRTRASRAMAAPVGSSTRGARVVVLAAGALFSRSVPDREQERYLFVRLRSPVRLAPSFTIGPRS